MAPEKSKSEQLQKKVREIAPEKADKVLTRYQKVQEGLHDALFAENVDERYAAAQAGMQRLEEMEDEILAKGEDAEKSGEGMVGERKEQREALVADFDQELSAIADSLGIGLQVAEAHDALDKERAEKEVKYYFGQIDVILGDYFEKSVVSKPRFVKAYLNRGERPRMDAKSIAEHFKGALPNFHAASETARKIVVDSLPELHKALMLFINGRASEGNKILWGIKTKIDGAKVVETEILPKLRAEKEKMHPAQMRHSEACAAMRNLVEKDGGGDPIRKAEAQEKVLVTYLELLKSAEGFAKLRESFVTSGPNGEDFQEQREYIFIKLVNEDLRSIETISVKTVEKSSKVMVAESLDETNLFQVPKEKTVKVSKLVARKEMIFVGNPEELQAKVEDTELSLLSTRRDLFLMTGDERYREAFEKGQEKINNDARTAALKEVNGTEDGYSETRAAVKEQIEMMSLQFAQIQKRQGEDPLEALSQNTAFLQYLYALRKELGVPVVGARLRMDIPLLHPLRAGEVMEGLGPESPFKNLQREAPELHAAFLSAIDCYIGMSHQMQVVDIFSKDRVFVKFMKDMTDFVKETKDFIVDFKDFMEAQERDDDSFSEQRINGIRARIAVFRLGTRVYNDVVTSQIFSRLREYEALIVGLVPGFEEEFKKLEEQMRKMNKICAQICRVMDFLYDDARGYQEWSWDKLVNLLSKLAAGVIIAVLVVGALTLLGPIGAGLIGLMVTGAIAGGAGYIGYIAQSQLIDDRPEEFTPEGLLQATAFGALFGAAGRFVGRPFGEMVGRFAQKANVKLASLTALSWMGNGGRILVGMLRKFGEKGLNRQVQQLLGKFAQHGLSRELPKEFLQEVFDAILEHLGKVIAPRHPWLGFMFQVLASGMHHAKTVKIDAIFAINGDVTVAMTDSSVSFEFSNRVKALEALRKNGAPAEVIAAFETNGFVNAVKDGVTIIVKPSNEPVMVRQLLANQTGQNAALLAGLRFHEADPDTKSAEGYTFEGSPEALMTRLESEFFVEMTKEGDIIATDRNGNKIIFEFANKHLGLEVAGLLNAGLELDAERRPTVTRAENVLPVLGQLTQMGYALEQNEHGIVAKKAGQPDVEISLDQTVAAEVAEGGRSVLELAAALNEDTDGFGARMLAKLNGAKDKVGEALLWATTKTQVELQAMMARIGRAIDARVAARLAVPGGLSLLTSGCTVEGATEWYFDQLINHGLPRTIITFLLTKMILNGGATWILHALVPKGTLGKVVGNAIWLPIKGMWLLGKYAFSGKFKQEIAENQPGVSFVPKNQPTKAEMQLENLGDLSTEGQAEFGKAFNQLKAVFKALRFDTSESGQTMFNDIMRLIYMNLRRADIQNGRTSPQAQPQQPEGRWGRQSRTAPPARSSLSPAQELAFIGQNLETELQTLLTQPLTDLQTLTMLESVQTTAIDQAMKMVDGFLTSKDIDPMSPQGKSIKAEVTRLFKLIADLKPASKHRQLALLEARRDILKPLKEKAEAIVKAFDELVAQNGVALTTEQKAIYDAAKADIDRYNEVDRAYGSLKRKLGNIRNKLRVLLPESPKSKAIIRAAFFVALMTAIGFAGNAMFGGDDEAAAGEGGGQPAEGGVGSEGDASEAREKAVGEDNAAANAAAEGNANALKRATEGLKQTYRDRKKELEELEELEELPEDDPDRSWLEKEVKRLEDQLRKNGITPEEALKESNVNQEEERKEEDGETEAEASVSETVVPETESPSPTPTIEVAPPPPTDDREPVIPKDSFQRSNEDEPI